MVEYVRNMFKKNQEFSPSQNWQLYNLLLFIASNMLEIQYKYYKKSAQIDEVMSV